MGDGQGGRRYDRGTHWRRPGAGQTARRVDSRHPAQSASALLRGCGASSNTAGGDNNLSPMISYRNQEVNRGSGTRKYPVASARDTPDSDGTKKGTAVGGGG